MEQFLDAPMAGRRACHPGSAGPTPVQDPMGQGSAGPWKIRGTFFSSFLEAPVPQSISFLLSSEITFCYGKMKPESRSTQSRGQINRTARTRVLGNRTVPPPPLLPLTRRACTCTHHLPMVTRTPGSHRVLLPRLSDICITNRVAFGTVLVELEKPDTSLSVRKRFPDPIWFCCFVSPKTCLSGMKKALWFWEPPRMRGCRLLTDPLGEL